MNPKGRGLGRGLNALFEDDEDDFMSASAPEELAAAVVADSPVSSKGSATLGVEQLEPSRFQPRKFFDDESLQELAESIKSHGLLQPIVVRKKPDAQEGGPQYEIIAGERRWRASQKAQLHEVSVIIKEMTDLEALEIALIENLQREDLNPVDEAMGLKRLMSEYEYTQEKLAQSLGKSRSYIANMVRLLNLPDGVLGYLETGDISAGHARALITVENAEDMVKQIVSEGLSVRETERLVAENSDRPAKAKSGSSGSSSASADKDVNTIALEKELSDLLGMRVAIDSKDNQKGKVTIEFKSLDQLDHILKRIMRSSG